MSREMIPWTKEEEEILKLNYPIKSREILLELLNGRTWRAIRGHSLGLGLTRSKEAVDNDRAKHLKEHLGVTSTWQLESVKSQSRKTNIERRGVEYPSQSAKVRDKVRETVQERYGVDNVFQSEEIKTKLTQTNIEKYGVPSPLQNEEIQGKVKSTNMERYGVENTFQLSDRVQQGMIRNHGNSCPLRVPEIKERQQQTNIREYGYITPAKNEEVRKEIKRVLNTDEVRERKYITMKKNGSFKSSDEELKFYEFLKEVDPNTEHHKLHPTLKHVIDFYMPGDDIWIQYDGNYWHGFLKENTGPQQENINKVMIRDQIQNENISNLIRFYSHDVVPAIKNGLIKGLIEDTISDKKEELKNNPPSCHQFRKKIKFYEEDINSLPFNTENLRASDFCLNKEGLTAEIISFIERYEWLGTIGVTPKWCFTARYKGFLGGVVLINEPSAYSRIMEGDPIKYEALIQRGASASWAPKNLGSRLIMFSCHWMVNNTEKRAFIGYADLNANERGIIYRACNFDYIGDNFGASELLRHPSIPRLFTSHSLRRTSVFKRWCKINNIPLEKSWFKQNGFKNLETIPPSIKRAWYDWGKKIVSESEKTKLQKKMKYVLILGRNKKETKNLKDTRTYEPMHYPLNVMNSNSPSTTPHPDWGKTRSRKSTIKDQLMIDSYGKKTVHEIAIELNESDRWVKRSIQKLSSQGKITRKNPPKLCSEMLSEENWNPQIKERAIHLRMNKLKSTKDICGTLKAEFNFEITTASLNFWLAKFNCPFPSKEDWLKKFLPPETVKSLLAKNYLRKDFVTYIKETHDVHISEDIISLYIRSIPT
jgi:hypothetical protein